MANNLPNDSIGSGNGSNQNQNLNSSPQPSTQNPSGSVGSIAKEQLESMPIPQPETAPIVEQKEHETIPEEVEGWLEKLERGEDIQLPQPITDDRGQVIVDSATPKVSEDNIVLPATEADINTGLKSKVTTSARWLAEWAIRLIKKFPGRIFYKQS